MSPAQKPLSGIRVLVGRARRQASKLSDELKLRGAEVIEIPFIEIRPPRSYKPLDTAIKQISKYDWLILTSVNGVEALAQRMAKLGVGVDAMSHLQMAAIGPATRGALQDLGLRVHVVPKQYVAEAVVASLRTKVNGKRILLARAKVARDVIPRELQKMGARVDVVETYQTVVPESSRPKLRSLLRDPERRPDVVTFTSSSTVKNFVTLLGGRGRPSHTVLNGIQFASIGPVTSRTMRELELPIHIEAKEYTIPGLVEAIVRHREKQIPHR
ncbi:MAG TPA: uroporphyrinogen-III synthase [Terriglobales bacterium]|nr:uroporphyrinogen-III synthase [Terriglobales bacterium]